MIDESSYSEAVAEELSLTSSAYASDVVGEVDLTSSAYGEDVAEAINEGVTPPTPVEPYNLRVMQYNIGHFNMGMASGNTALIGTNTSYAASYPQFFNYSTQLQRWLALMASVNADIIGLPEYNDNFGYNGGSLVSTINSGIFNGYNISAGKKVVNGWWQNALASKFAMSELPDQDVDHLNGAYVPYVREAHVTINGKQVTIAVTHLNWSQNDTYANSRVQKEIPFLVNRYKDMEYVILCGDFNTDGGYPIVRDPSNKEGLKEFQPFVDAGFTLANQYGVRELLTSAASNSRPDQSWTAYPFSYLDNIIVKGFTMSNVRVIDDGTITDHCAVVCDLTMIEEGGES